MAKVTKASVAYSHGMGASRCSNCKHFQPPNACELVEGFINPDYWCKRFSMASK